MSAVYIWRASLVATLLLVGFFFGAYILRASVIATLLLVGFLFGWMGWIVDPLYLALLALALSAGAACAMVAQLTTQ